MLSFVIALHKNGSITTLFCDFPVSESLHARLFGHWEYVQFHLQPTLFRLKELAKQKTNSCLRYEHLLRVNHMQYGYSMTTAFSLMQRKQQPHQIELILQLW